LVELLLAPDGLPGSGSISVSCGDAVDLACAIGLPE
jgi:hypothetical protein